MAKPIQYCKVKKKKKKEVHEENQEAVEAEWEKLWTPIEGHGHQLPNFHFIRKWECVPLVFGMEGKIPPSLAGS